MAEFTKGEWQTVFFKGMNEQEMYIKVSGSACICKILDRPSAEKKSNARLIAAAPDLLAACKAQEEADEWFGASNTGRKLKDRAKELRQAAISQAEKGK